MNPGNPSTALDSAISTPVLFIVFNRPETTQRVFDEIRAARPSRLYVAADGPRRDHATDQAHVNRVREIVSRVDWPCELVTRFRDENLGCQAAVSGAISWFFEHEPEGIILEDDVLPSRAFFHFVERGLEQYRDDDRVFVISGTNLLADSSAHNTATFSLHGSIWGWGSWRRAWARYRVDALTLTDEEIDLYANSVSQRAEMLEVLRWIRTDAYNSWDYQWLICRIRHQGLTLMPRLNYVENIGFESGTHYTGGAAFEFPARSTSLEDRPAIEPIYDTGYDLALWNYKNSFARRTILVGKWLARKVLRPWT